MRLLKQLSTVCLLLLLISCRPQAPQFEASGFYRVEELPGRWWLVDPEGNAFYSIGLNHVSSGGYTDAVTGNCPYCESIASNYENSQHWRDHTVQRLLKWGFNTIGAWSDRDGFDSRVARTPVLHLSGGVADYFSDDFRLRIQSQIASKVIPYRDDPNIIGWYLDNELDWGRDWRSDTTRLADYLSLPEDSPGYQVADRYRGDPDGFLTVLASHYFELVCTQLRKADPNHLLLGIRASTIATPPEVIAAAADWLDVFSINHYDLPKGTDTMIYSLFDSTPIDGWLERYHELSGLPIMITEFTYRSLESDVPNSYPPIYYLFATQAERAEAYRLFAERSFAKRYIVGHHWFEYFDGPPGGRSDGEDSNFGLVNNDDEPYTEMVQAMAAVHQFAPHRPQGVMRDWQALWNIESPVLAAGNSYGEHLVTAIELDANAPAGIYQFKIDEPAPKDRLVSVQLYRDGKAVPEARLNYLNDYQLLPINPWHPPVSFNFPGYLSLSLSVNPGPYRYVSLFNLYNTVFDGQRMIIHQPHK